MNPQIIHKEFWPEQKVNYQWTLTAIIKETPQLLQYDSSYNKAIVINLFNHLS